MSPALRPVTHWASPGFVRPGKAMWIRPSSDVAPSLRTLALITNVSPSEIELGTETSAAKIGTVGGGGFTRSARVWTNQPCGSALPDCGALTYSQDPPAMWCIVAQS